MSGIGIAILIVILTNIFLGLLVFYKDQKKIVNRLFLAMTSAAAIWSFGILLFTELKEITWALAGLRIAFGGASLVAVSLFLFSRTFPRQLKPLSRGKYFIILLLPLLFIIISIFTSLIVRNLEVKSWGLNPVYGPLYLFFVGYFLVYLSLTIINFIKQFRKSSGIQRLQFKYLFLGLIGAIIIGTTTNLIIPLTTGLSKFSKLGPIGTIFFSAFTGYAIVKRKLFGIRVILTQLLVVLIAVLLLIQLLVSETTFEYIWKGVLFITFLVFGYLLIKSVLREIKQREEMERLAQDLERANVRLKKLDKARTEFMSMASHQLRTPLTAIKGYISLALEGQYGKMPEALKEKLKNVYISNERLINLVGDLLTVSRIEMGKLTAKKELTQIEELVQSCVEEMKIEAKKKGLKLYFRKPKQKLPKIKIDPFKIRQVITNLIDNAIKYTPKGEIEIRAKKTDSKIQISVKDTGEGLSEEEKESIFEGFTRGRAGTVFHIEGAGLGLYVAKKYLDLHGGEIRAESKGKGKGSTFYVELPLHQE